MKQTGINIKSIKSNNESALLYLLNSEKALSRKEIAARLELTPAAVTKISKRLIDEGYIKEIGEAETEAAKAGRREILLTLNSEEKLILGINAEVQAITLSISDVGGRLLKFKALPFCENTKEVILAAKEFLIGFDRRDKIIGIGVCVIGSPNQDDFGVWKDERLAEKFEKAFSLPCVVENNVKAFALSELIYGNTKNESSVLFLKWGYGIGSAIVANGKVFSGGDSSVTEIGHYIVNPAGRRCRCGRYGCLETVASAEEIIKETGEKLTVEQLAASNDERIVHIIDEKIDLLALALTNTATILNAQNIVFFGAMFYNKSISEKLSRQCLRYNGNLKSSMLTVSSLNEQSDYIGTTAAAAQKFFFEKQF